jgi:hypothetical protein
MNIGCKNNLELAEAVRHQHIERFGERCGIALDRRAQDVRMLEAVVR